jgi:hypothetical protein
MCRRLYRWRVSTRRPPTTCDYARMSGECRTGGLSSLPVRRKDRLCAHSFRTGHQLGRSGMGRVLPSWSARGMSAFLSSVAFCRPSAPGQTQTSIIYADVETRAAWRQKLARAAFDKDFTTLNRGAPLVADLVMHGPKRDASPRLIGAAKVGGWQGQSETCRALWRAVRCAPRASPS